MTDRPTCESCGADADVRLVSDDSTWCRECDDAARRLGYDEDEDHDRRRELLVD